jgi:hypothetical protein
MSDSGQIVRSSDEHAAEPPLRAPVALGARGASSSAASPHSHRFLAVTATLLGVAIGAVGIALAIVLTSGDPGPAPAWSTWSPPDNGLAGERDIANEVAPFYRASPATQLVIVTVQNVSSTSTGGNQIAFRDPTTGSLSALSGNSAVYNLCGLGPNCAISTGTASQARLLLLRREALELALYTFRYVGNVDNVVAILPPGRTLAAATLTPKPPSPGKTQTATPLNVAIVFQRQALRHFTDRPVRLTLPEPLPPTVAQMPNAPEAELVSVITGQALFRQQVVQAQDGSNVIVLDPLPPQ